MWSYVAIISCLATAILSDPFMFFDCDQVEVCNVLRNRTLEYTEKYIANIDRFSLDKLDHYVSIPLINKKSEKLTLQLGVLEGGKARIVVEDKNIERFQLGDIVIEKQPMAVPLVINIVDEDLVIVPEDRNYQVKIIVTKGPPFQVKFIYDDKLDIVLDADQLSMITGSREWYTFKLQFADAKKLYGLSYHAEGLALRDNRKNKMDPYRLKNSDAWGHKAFSPKALYGSIPAIYGHTVDRTYGIFLHNAAEQWIDISIDDGVIPSAYFMVERGAFDLYILFGPRPKDVVHQLVAMVGKAHLPQLWTLGYHQCRFSYKSQEDVMDVVSKMDQFDIPFDAIWLDGDHANYSKWFQWNETTYNNPIELQNNISATGRKCVAISDPHVKVEDEYSVYKDAKGKFFIKAVNGSDYEDDCWPGLSTWFDYLNPEARKYYASLYSFDKFPGSTPTLAGIWNDMNEPAVFNEALEKTVSVDSVHYNNVKHGNIHNVYGHLGIMATHKGLMDRDKGKKRPFILTRSHFAGSQRYAAMWTGDNSATWEHFAVTYPQCMTSNMGGMVFCGADIGGFIGDPTEELLVRWYQGAVWTPFFRGHSSRESQRREPYLNSNIRDILRSTIRLRYKHIPSIYTTFYEYTRTGDPIIRPLFFNYPDILEADHQLLLGDNIMAVAVTAPNLTEIDIQFPGIMSNEVWYRIDMKDWSYFEAGNHIVPLCIETSPVFYRGGSIIARKEKKVRHTGEMENQPYSLYVNLDQNNQASGTLYVDDSLSFDYENKKKYFYAVFKYSPEAKGILISIIDGDFASFHPRIEEVIIHRPTHRSNNAGHTSVQKYEKSRDGRSLRDLDITNRLRISKDKSLLITL